MIHKATHQGELKIGEIILPCAVLEDGTRVLSERGVGAALGTGSGGGSSGSAQRLPRFLQGNALNPFISAELRAQIEKPIQFSGSGLKRGNAVPATLLPQICAVWLDAWHAGVLPKSQEAFARQADVLMRGFAHVGIVALVDEATGYQEVRAKDELNKILAKYIAKELLPWAKRFPDEFYQQIFRLHGWPYDPASVKRPSVVGHMTNELIYEQLPPGVLEELKTKNPKNERGIRSHKHHQFLTDDIGNPHLEKQIVAVTTLMRAAPNKGAFMRSFRRAFPRAGQQEELPLGIDEE